MSNYNGGDLTILICCYNAEKFLDKCLNSLIYQNKSNLSHRIIFVNDASTDNSLKILESYTEKLKNLMLINNKKNIGLVQSCNKALGIMQTPYFMRLDADDYLSTDALKNISNELTSLNKEDFIIFQRWNVVDSRIQKVNVTEDIYTWIATGAVFAKSAIESLGGYNKEYWEEYDLYIRLLENGFKHRISFKRIYYYRQGHNSMTRDCKKKGNGLKNLIRKWGTKTLEKYGDFQILNRLEGLEYA